MATKEPGKIQNVEGYNDYGVDNFAISFRKDDTASMRTKSNEYLSSK